MVMFVDSHAHTYDLKKGYAIPQDILPVVVGYSNSSNRKAALEAKAHGWPLVLGIAPQTAIREDLSHLDEWVAFIKVRNLCSFVPRPVNHRHIITGSAQPFVQRSPVSTPP